MRTSSRVGNTRQSMRCRSGKYRRKKRSPQDSWQQSGNFSRNASSARFTGGAFLYILQRPEYRRDVAQPGSASALGAEGRWFESSRPDHLFLNTFMRLRTPPKGEYRPLHPLFAPGSHSYREGSRCPAVPAYIGNVLRGSLFALVARILYGCRIRTILHFHYNFVPLTARQRTDCVDIPMDLQRCDICTYFAHSE